MTHLAIAAVADGRARLIRRVEVDLVLDSAAVTAARDVDLAHVVCIVLNESSEAANSSMSYLPAGVIR